MEHFTDNLINSLLESSPRTLTAGEKMQLFDQGLRHENVAACGDDKLKTYRGICIIHGYKNALAQIEAEMKKRGLLTAAGNVVPPSFDSVDWVNHNLNLCLPSTLDLETILGIADDAANNRIDLVTWAKGETYRPRLLRYLFAAILVNAQDVQAKLLEVAKNAQYTKDALQLIANEITKNANTYAAYTNEALKNFETIKSIPENLQENKDLIEKVEKHEILNPKLWNADHTLKIEIEEKINQIIKEFLDSLAEDEIKIEVKDILIIGSNASYNYNDGSDLDLHLIAKTDTLDCPEKHLAKLYSAYRSLFNKKFNIDFYGINVELYIETDDTQTVSNGVYSVLNKRWIKEPIPADIPDINDEEIQKEVGKWTEKYNEVVANRNIDDIDSYIEQVYDLRKQAMEAGEEYSQSNLVFKEIRNAGYLDRLKELKAKIKSQELSLESLKEDLIVYNTMKDLEKAFSAFKNCADSAQKQELRKAVHTALFQTHNKKDINQGRWIEIYNATHDEKWNEDLTESLSDAKAIIADQLRGEWEAIQNYNQAIKDLEEINLTDFNSVINLLNDISTEEETHCGELQTALEMLDSEVTDNINQGKDEAEEKLTIIE